MPLDLNVNLPETAKALSAPVTKLIEVVGAGCGKWYEPTGIRRKAQADADALVILEEAKGRASEIAARAAHRLLDVEERRQENIEAIVKEAMPLLPDSVSDEPVDPDWSARFFAECQDISNPEMRAIWAKLLAGEVAQPGSFSPRTLWVLKNLTRSEAQHFNQLTKACFCTPTDKARFPLYGLGSNAFWVERGLNFATLQALETAGLIALHPLGVTLPDIAEAILRGSTTSLLVSSATPTSIPLGKVTFTAAGIELADICEWDIPEERLDAVAKAYGPPFTVKRITISEVKPSGDVHYLVIG